MAASEQPAYNEECEDTDDPPLAHREQEHMWLTEFFEQVVCGVGYDADEWQEFTREISDAAGKPLSVDTQIAMLDSFDDRLNAKREQLPDAIENCAEEAEDAVRRYKDDPLKEIDC